MNLPKLLLGTALVLLAAGCATGNAPGALDVPICENAETMAPVALEFDRLADDGMTYGPRLRSAGPRGRMRIERVDMADLSRMPTGTAVIEIRLDGLGEVLSLELVERSGDLAFADQFVENVRRFRFFPAQRNGCGIPSVFEYRSPRN